MEYIITEPQKIKRILETQPFVLRDKNFIFKLLSQLSICYRTLTPEEKGYIAVYAKAMWNRKKYKGKIKSHDIIRHSPTLFITARTTFIGLNFKILHRNITDTVRKNVWMGHPAMAPALLQDKIYENDSITVTWKDYTPPAGQLSGFKATIYHTLFAKYRLVVDSKIFKVKSQILGVFAQPTPQKLTIQYLPISKHALIKISNIDFACVSLQMDTICLIEDFLPVVSFPSNLLYLEINNKYSFLRYQEIIKQLVNQNN